MVQFTKVGIDNLHWAFFLSKFFSPGLSHIHIPTHFTATAIYDRLTKIKNKRRLTVNSTINSLRNPLPVFLPHSIFLLPRDSWAEIRRHG